MASKKRNLRNDLRDYKFEFDLLQKIPCSKQENKEYQKILKETGKLPEGIYAYMDASGEISETEFCTVYQPDLTEAEIAEYLTYKKLDYLKTIRNCVVFFTVLTIIGIVLSFFALLGAF